MAGSEGSGISNDDYLYSRIIRACHKNGYGSIIECSQMTLSEAIKYMLLEQDFDARFNEFLRR